MESKFKNKIIESLQPAASRFAKGRGLQLLRIEVRGSEQVPVIEVLLDGDRGITIDDCESVSKDLNTTIETGKLVKGNYRLDVLSPGIEEPVMHDWQFKRNIGRLVEVHYADGENQHTLHGHLREFSKAEIAIEPIHIKVRKPASPKAVTTEDGPIVIQPDEQVYVEPVELVKIAREHLTNVVVQAEIR
jgi:ribosome maturation factor RimP